MARWATTIHMSHNAVKVLVTDEEGCDLLRARLPRRCDHPRALLTLLEGMALWSGNSLTAVISAPRPVYAACDPHLFGGDLYPVDSALVRLDFLELNSRQFRLRGLGSFRDVLLAHQRGRR